jgi:hypothetical protein
MVESHQTNPLFNHYTRGCKGVHGHDKSISIHTEQQVGVQLLFERLKGRPKISRAYASYSDGLPLIDVHTDAMFCGALGWSRSLYHSRISYLRDSQSSPRLRRAGTSSTLLSF